LRLRGRNRRAARPIIDLGVDSTGSVFSSACGNQDSFGAIVEGMGDGSGGSLRIACPERNIRTAHGFRLWLSDPYQLYRCDVE